MSILLLNSGSSSLKATLMDAANANVLAQGLADWAGAATHYQFTGLEGSGYSEEVSWTGHASAVTRFIDDLLHVDQSC